MRNLLTSKKFQQSPDVGTSGNASTTAEPVNDGSIKISFNAKYKKGADGKTLYQKVKQADNTEVDMPVVETPARVVSVKLDAPKFAELSPDILAALYNDRLEVIAKSMLKDDSTAVITDGASFSYQATVADIIGERQEIPDELLEQAQKAFATYLAGVGKSDKAQKNNQNLLVAGVALLAKTDARIVTAYKENLQKFIESSQPELISEIAPVLSRANSRLEKAAAIDVGGLV